MPEPVTRADLTPAPASSSRHCPARLLVRDVDRLGVERDRARAQARDRREASARPCCRPSEAGPCPSVPPCCLVSLLVPLPASGRGRERRQPCTWLSLTPPHACVTGSVTARKRDDAVIRLAVGVAARIRSLVTQVDQPMPGERQRRVVQRRRAPPAMIRCTSRSPARARPHVQRHEVLAARPRCPCSSRARVAWRERDVGKLRAARHVVVDARAAEQRQQSAASPISAA